MIILVIGLVFSFGCEEEKPIKQDIPRYTADQVIYVARAAAPKCFSDRMTASWSVEYLSHGNWLVTKTCYWDTYPSKIKHSTTQYYFYEDTGTLTLIRNK